MYSRASPPMIVLSPAALYSKLPPLEELTGERIYLIYWSVAHAHLSVNVIESDITCF